MPVIQPGAKVLVTGANGYIAMWVVRKLLEKGYSVRATVRSANKGTHMLEYFKGLGYENKIEAVVVSDFTKEGAFDEAVKGVDAIEHTASPSHWKAKTPEEIIDPAVKGTLGVLKSAQKFGPDVKRIVISSSLASVNQFSDPPETFYDDKSWNEESVRVIEELGDKAHPRDMYCASKTLAERAAWKFYKDNKNTLGWDLTVLNIPWVFGPPIQEVSSPGTLNESSKLWWTIVIEPVEGSMDPSHFLSTKAPWADVRDIGEVHAVCLEKEAAGGERIIVTAGTYTWFEFVDLVNALDSSLLPGGNPVKALTSVETKGPSFDEKKVNRICGIKWITKEKAARDIMEDAAKRGWLKA